MSNSPKAPGVSWLMEADGLRTEIANALYSALAKAYDEGYTAGIKHADQLRDALEDIEAMGTVECVRQTERARSALQSVAPHA